MCDAIRDSQRAALIVVMEKVTIFAFGAFIIGSVVHFTIVEKVCAFLAGECAIGLADVKIVRVIAVNAF